jgi:glycosyl hydrolase family 26
MRMGSHLKGRLLNPSRRLFGLIGVLSVAGAVALLVAALGTENVPGAARPASTTIQKAPDDTNLSSVSAIPNSMATAKVPSKFRGSSNTGKSGGSADRKLGNGPGGTANGASGKSTTGASFESGSITAGNSKANCITLNFPGGVLDQSVISAATRLTGIAYNCIDTFANPVQSWAEWETPWMLSTASDGWDSWLAQSSTHQVIVGIDLIPQSVSNNDNPLTWEQPCASGSYDQYATALATNLVSYGARNVVIRLGVEANGSWEDDYVGSTATEMSDWAKCFDNEVAAMRAVPSANFLFVWNPNVCTDDLPLNEWYPGNSYVDIIGVDAYDKDCLTLNTVSQEGWATYSTDSSGNTPNDPNFPSLANIEAFASSNGKPLSFPEWAIYSGTSDDTAYITDMARIYNGGNFSFESYYDTGGNGVAMLGSAIPNATAAYSQAFK